MKRMLIVATLVWSSAATAQDSCKFAGSDSVETRVRAALAMIAASEKCGFGIDFDKLETWVNGDFKRPADVQNGFAELMILGSEELMENPTESVCRSCKTEATNKGWLIE